MKIKKYLGLLILVALLASFIPFRAGLHADNGITFDLNMAVDPSGGGTTDPAVGVHTYAENSVITITATPTTFYTFDHWAGDVADPDAASTTVTMDGDKTVTSHFVRISDITTMGTLSLIPTIECIGVVVNYTGDNNQNNSAVLQYRQSGDAWKTAPEMYADRANHQYRGSIFWLTTNTDYEVKVTFTDPDGGGSVTATTKTRNDNPPSNGNTYYVATTGSDSDPGTISQPFKTIQKAADTVSAGDTVYVRAGTYNEQVEITTSGTINYYIAFRPFENEIAILDGQGTLSSLFDITGDYIRIKGFTIRNSGDGSAVLISGADGVIVEDNAIEDPNIGGTGTQGGIRLDHGASNSLLQRNTISVNAGPAGGDGRGTIFGIVYWKPGWGHVIRDNVMTGGVSFGDGFGGGPEDTPEYMNNLDFYNNVIRGAQDDGIQPEGGNVNVRIWNNRIESCFVGIAVCPSLQGPAYIFRNTMIHSTAAAFKIGDNSYGRIYIYHNTYYTTTAADGYTQTNPGLGNIVSRNNIIQAGRYTVELASSSNGSSHDFDYDNLYTTDSGRFVKWNGIKYGSPSTFLYNTGQEPNGISADSEFVDPERDDLALQPTSTCINMGVVLPGFNDASSPWPYQSSAPDLGAYEATESAATQPPSVTNDSATSVNETIAVLNGTIIDDGGGSCLYRFEYDTESGEPYAYNTGWIGINTTGQSFISNITGLSPETIYYYRAQAKNNYGTGSSSELFLITTSIEDIDWSAKLCDSVLERYTPSTFPYWGYTQGLLLEGMWRVYQRTGNTDYYYFIKNWVDRFVTSDGLDSNIVLDSLDNMMPGVLLCHLYQATGNNKYQIAAQQIRNRIDTYPRTSDGGLAHMTRYDDQLWLDGAFMLTIFLSNYGEVFDDAIYCNNECSNQLIIYNSHLQNVATKLAWHAWDEDGSTSWADPTTHLSPEVWCRALGWYVVACHEVLEKLPTDHADRQAIINILVERLEGIKNYQDSTTGLWYQVVDKGNLTDNWVEQSSGCMYTYAISKAIDAGYVGSTEYYTTAKKGYEGILSNIELDPTGKTNLYRTCEGTSVGSYLYYINREQLTNNFHGQGAFLLANEQQRTKYTDLRQLYQTENGNLYNAETETTNRGFTGASYVNFYNEVGSYVEITLNAASTETKTLLIRYANGTTDDRPMKIYVNGNVVDSSLSFIPTGAWSAWRARTTSVSLNAGDNTIRLESVNSTGGPNIDWIALDSTSPTNNPPILGPIGNKSVYEEQLLEFTILAFEPDGDPLTYSAFNLPSGASFDSDNRTFSWIPGTGQAGSYPDVHFKVTDGELADSENITITVTVVPTFALTMAVDPTGGGTTNPGAGVHWKAKGAVVNITATAEPGWYFSGWSGDLSGETNPESITMDDNKTVTATFALTSVISGITAEANGDAIPGATVKLYLDGVLQSTTNSGPDGQYELVATEEDEYTVVASAAGFKNETQAISITSLGDGYTLDFIGNSGLIPQAPDLSYVLACANHWLYPPVVHPELALSMSKVLAVANAWLYH